MNYERAVKELQDTVIVISEIERRQSKLIREHSELLAELLDFRYRTEESIAVLAEGTHRLDLKMEELTGKLNGLIGCIDGLRPPPPTA